MSRPQSPLPRGPFAALEVIPVAARAELDHTARDRDRDGLLGSRCDIGGRRWRWRRSHRAELRRDTAHHPDARRERDNGPPQWSRLEDYEIKDLVSVRRLKSATTSPLLGSIAGNVLSIRSRSRARC